MGLILYKQSVMRDGEEWLEQNEVLVLKDSMRLGSSWYFKLKITNIAPVSTGLNWFQQLGTSAR